MKKRKVRKRYLVKLAVFALIILIGIIPVRLAIAFYQAPVPQAIFVLGGDFDRMEFAAQFWQSHVNLDVLVSDYQIYIEPNRRFFEQSGVPTQQLYLDGRATDTVTNFTTLVDYFVSRKLQHIYLITSDYHVRRAKAIAAIVLGSYGIAVTPLAVPSQADNSESWLRVLRDCGRSVLWVFSGRSGASLNPQIQ